MEPELNFEQLANSMKIVEDTVKKCMTKEAISRYGNLKVAHPEIAIKAITAIAQAIQTGQIDTIDDAQFKEILSIVHGQKRKTQIKIK